MLDTWQRLMSTKPCAPGSYIMADVYTAESGRHDTSSSWATSQQAHIKLQDTFLGSDNDRLAGLDRWAAWPSAANNLRQTATATAVLCLYHGKFGYLYSMDQLASIGDNGPRLPTLTMPLASRPPPVTCCRGALTRRAAQAFYTEAVTVLSTPR